VSEGKILNWLTGEWEVTVEDK